MRVRARRPAQEMGTCPPPGRRWCRWPPPPSGNRSRRGGSGPLTYALVCFATVWVPPDRHDSFDHLIHGPSQRTFYRAVPDDDDIFLPNVRARGLNNSRVEKKIKKNRHRPRRILTHTRNVIPANVFVTRVCVRILLIALSPP